MNNESRTLWISLGAGLFATMLLYSYSQEQKAQYDKKLGTTKRVVVAVKDIAEMETIDDTMLDVVERPSDFIEPNAVKNKEEIIGQVAATPIKKGEQVLDTKLLTPGPDTGIALQVSPGKRAITLPVDEIRGVAKLIRPGDRIDIIATLEVGKGVAIKKETTVFLEDKIVLATGVTVVNNLPRIIEADASGKNIIQTTLTGDTKYSTITVEVSLKEAQDLVYILSTTPGNLYYVLKNPNDRAAAPRMPSSTAESILGKPEVSFAPVQQPVQVPQYAPPTLPTQPNRQQTPNKNNKSGFQRL